VDGVEAENIIVIMNEAFADLRVINDDIISDQYMPFIDSLNENTIKGNLCVPVFAMQTCDTEFEVLLGASTQYTPATPYQLVMKSPTESMVSYLKEQGYYAQAFHPYDAANWNRDNVYNYLGFEEFLDYTDVEKMNYEGSIKLREYCSDAANYAKIIEEYEKHNDGKYFIFNVTCYVLEYVDVISMEKIKLEIPKKSGVFSKESPTDIFSRNLYRKANSCALCEKLDSQMSDAAENFAHLWANEDDFRKMFENSKGLCLEHTALAAQKSSGEIHGKKKEEFLLMLAENQKKQLDVLYQNLHNFTLSFDYRNAGKELTAEEKDSVKTAISYLSKDI